MLCNVDRNYFIRSSNVCDPLRGFKHIEDTRVFSKILVDTLNSIQKLPKNHGAGCISCYTGYLTTGWQVKMCWYAMGIHVT